MMKVPASGGRLVYVKEHHGLSPCWFNVLGRPSAAKAPTCTLSTSDCAADADQRKQSARLLLQSLPPPITCSRMGRSIMISAPPTSIAQGLQRQRCVLTPDLESILHARTGKIVL